MDISLLKELNLPFATVTATAVWHLLGPSTKYLGGKTQELTQYGVENLERVFKHAIQRLPADASDEGVVPPRVLKSAMMEGAFIEDEIAAAYLGGVLASSKTESGRDDRGVSVNAMISRLSVFQLRLHYVCYMATHYLLQGVESDFSRHSGLTNRIHFGTSGLLIAMGFTKEELGDPGFNIPGVLTHALYGLSKEKLIGEWEFQWDSGLECTSTPIGTELFLWANGQGRQSVEFFFDREFEPIDNGDDGIFIIPGRNFIVQNDDGEKVTVNGFSYAHAMGTRHSCKVPPQEQTSTEDAESTDETKSQ